MPYCPECKYEYVAGIATCPDCRVPLVDRLPEEKPPSMVTVGSYLYEVEAQAAKLKLESCGIASEVSNDIMAGTDITMAYAQGGVHLAVNRADVEKAVKVLESDDELISEN